MATRRRINKGIKENDLLSQFENGEGLSEKSKKTLDQMAEREKSKQSSVHKDPMFQTGAVLDLVLLAYMQPQSANPRFFPVKKSKDGSEEEIAKLDNCVVCEKGILENRLDRSNPRYKDVEEEIETIKELASQLKHNDLIHPIVVWRANMSSYPIVSGHRRYFALYFLYGDMIKVKAKVYPSKPKNVNVLRHVENANRKQLKGGDTIRSFTLALSDIAAEIDNAKGKTERTRLACDILGQSPSLFRRYENLTKGGEKVLAVLDNQIFTSLREFETEITKAKNELGEQGQQDYLSFILSNRKAVSFDEYSNIVQSKIKKEATGKTKKVGKPKSYISFPKVKVSNGDAILRLLKEDVTKLDLDIKWDEVDVANADDIEFVLQKVLKALSSKKGSK